MVSLVALEAFIRVPPHPTTIIIIIITHSFLNLRAPMSFCETEHVVTLDLHCCAVDDAPHLVLASPRELTTRRLNIVVTADWDDPALARTAPSPTVESISGLS